MEKNEKKRLLRNDILFIAALLAIVLIAGLCLYLFRGEGNTVTVLVDGKEYATYSLDKDRVEDIHTGEDGLNRLVIQDGKAWVETASCPDGICANHKPIHRDGESIVCLPNKVVITVHADEITDEPQVDVEIK